MTTVAQAMGYKNVGSAENKWHQIKKKYSIDMRTCRSGEPKVGKESRRPELTLTCLQTKRLGANEPASPKKATPKRAPRKKAAPVPKEAEPSEEESDKAVEASPSSP